jgi:translation initiation factor 2 beta subunit (eIF-2beta)/eIF-5
LSHAHIYAALQHSRLPQSLSRHTNILAAKLEKEMEKSESLRKRVTRLERKGAQALKSPQKIFVPTLYPKTLQATPDINNLARLI